MELEALGRSASLEVMRIGEPGIDVRRGSPQEAELRRAWLSAAQNLSIRLQTASRQAPKRPSMGGDPNVLMAYQQLESASQALRQLITSGSGHAVPPRSYRQGLVDQAQQQVQQARRYIAGIQR
jgi:hypothetical protein